MIWVFDPAYQGVLHLSKNILPVKDIVQQDILAHPKVFLPHICHTFFLDKIARAGVIKSQRALFHTLVLSLKLLEHITLDTLNYLTLPRTCSYNLGGANPISADYSLEFQIGIGTNWQ